MGPKHPYADQFPNRQAWQFEKALRDVTVGLQSPESLQRWINAWPTVMGWRHDPEMATAWRAFVNRKLADLPWPARPDQVRAVTTTRARHAIRALRGSAPPRRAAPATAPVPPTVAYRRDTGERAQVPEAAPYLRRAGPEIETARPVGQPTVGGPQVYAVERQRAPGGHVPAGWVTEHVGSWNGRETEVVYNPRRHQVMVTRHIGVDGTASLEADGWQRLTGDGGRVAWTRDRLTATRAALARHDHAIAIEPPPGPELRPALGLER